MTTKNPKPRVSTYHDLFQEAVLMAEKADDLRKEADSWMEDAAENFAKIYPSLVWYGKFLRTFAYPELLPVPVPRLASWVQEMHEVRLNEIKQTEEGFFIIDWRCRWERATGGLTFGSHNRVIIDPLWLSDEKACKAKIQAAYKANLDAIVAEKEARAEAKKQRRAEVVKARAEASK